jgi:hypothetical protein
VPSGGTCSVTCTPGYTPSTTTVTCTLGTFSSATCTGKHVWFVSICNVCLRCTILCGGAALRCFCWGPGCTTHNLLTTVYVLPLPYLLMLLSLSCSWCSQRLPSCNCLHQQWQHCMYQRDCAKWWHLQCGVQLRLHTINNHGHMHTWHVVLCHMHR